MRYREEAIECVKDHVLQIHKQIYAKYEGDFDRIYTEGYNSKSYTGRVIESGKVYELSYLESQGKRPLYFQNNKAYIRVRTTNIRKYMMRTIVTFALFIAALASAQGVETVNGYMSKQDSLLLDYDYFFSQLEQIHPDPYSAFGGKDGFDKAVKQLREELANRDSLTLNEMQVEVTKLISALHDGHTYIGYDKAPKKVEDQWVPLKFKVIPDGIIVNGYTPELESLKGAMLCEVEGEPLESVLDRLDKLVVSENRYGLMGNACRNIGNTNTLRQLFPTFNKEQVSMKFHMVNGKDTLVSLPFYPNGPFWENIVWTSTDERFPHNNFEYHFVDDSKQTMVMCINSVVSADIPNLESYGLKSNVIVADVFAKMLREMKAANSPRLIIDLRGNHGGWTMIMYAALYELYGKRFMDTDLGMHFATKVSDGWLKKNNMTLEQLNQYRGTSLKMGDFIEQSSSISSFDWFMCADKSILEAQHGEPIYTPEEIYVVTDVQTFSSAFHTAYMLWKMGAKVVGVTSGQAPNTFMEVTRFKLPNTGLECSASNSLQSCFPTDHPMAKAFTPDIQLSYDDYRQFDFSKDAELLFIEKLNYNENRKK